MITVILVLIWLSGVMVCGRGIKKCADASAADGIMQYLFLLIVNSALIYWIMDLT